MVNDLKVFSSTEFGELGVMLIDGKEYFPATQCAKILGYKNPKDAILRHCKGVVKRDLPTNGGVQSVNYIPEGDLYRLIVSSKLPGADKFERWVFEEVLPSIRRTGCYGAPDIEQIIAKTASAVVSEVMKQLAPLIIPRTTVKLDAPTAIKERSYKKPRNANSKIARLDEPLRISVEEMLLSEKYTYQVIVEYLSGFGISISTAAVCRYNEQLHKKSR